MFFSNDLAPGPEGNYLYRGCSENVHYGLAVSSEFVDAGERNKNTSQERKLMNDHNNRAGRQVIMFYIVIFIYAKILGSSFKYEKRM